ncbi:hypothetical protein [Streptomyces hokutonensis]|uniref:hypothetical protein n=1 Tax=Streptomyces hokutonensis TaxID=1306990 RepID=UPI0036B20833
MDDSGVTHVTWAGVPTAAEAATTPAGFSPNGDGSSDSWTPSWTHDRPVNWTLTLKSGSTQVRSLTGTSSTGKVTLRRTVPAAAVTAPAVASSAGTTAAVPVTWVLGPVDRHPGRRTGPL